MYGYTNEHRKLPKWLVALVIAGGIGLGGCLYWGLMRLWWWPPELRGIFIAVELWIATIFLFWNLSIDVLCRNIMVRCDEMCAEVKEIRTLELKDNKGRAIKKHTQYFLRFADDPEYYRVTYVAYKRFRKLAESSEKPIVCTYKKRQSIYGAIDARKITILEDFSQL